ncbi:basal-body rod modification protein FlgD [Sideroxyarcus emersonii]|uniref:Basal-body rod modification protein FlgD n=1 Tax=Sideroxyarcus emersonii TaxID=2764705 RepID=A0AAN1X855_9PROT|nr:flagellar hook assembly protein FlgD [Sideroxyarcus emersonii]BCK86690.1 basal-body rod modification protein FlgD [Sideroxyarcus emersonii]
MTTSVQSSTSSTAAQSITSTASSQLAATQDRFLTLLVTQLQNQDPLNPMDNSQVTSQMAQLSTVSGINQLNATVQALSSSMATSQSLQATSMIGHAALVPGSQISLANSQGTAAVELTQPADSVTVNVSDASGNVVRTLQLGQQSAAGVVNFAWDGKDNTGATVADGTYQFSATAMVGTSKSSPTTLSYGMVNSVSLTSNGPALGMGALGDVALSAVRQVL